MPLMTFLIVPKEFLAIKATIEAITTFEGKSTLSATASVLSKISFALVIARLIEKKIITKAIPMIRKIMDQITTKTISAVSKTDIVTLSHGLSIFPTCLKIDDLRLMIFFKSLILNLYSLITF